MLPIALPAQYYLTGEVVDYHGDKLQNVGITVLSSGLTFHSGLHGEFGIVSRTMDDTLTFAVDGYETFTIPAHSTEIMQVALKTVPFSTAIGQDRQVSLFRGVRPRDGSGGVRAASLAYSSRIENPYVPQSATVSFIGAPHLSSYHTIRRFLDMGSIVPPDAVKIEEMLNYFNFSYEEPDKWDAFHCSSQLVTCPWNQDHQLLFLNVCARRADFENKPPANLVLLLDATGSMDLPDKLPLVKTGIRTLVDNLRDIDVLSVVEYGADVKVLLAGVPGSQKGKIMMAIERLKPDGPSPRLERHTSGLFRSPTAVHPRREQQDRPDHGWRYQRGIRTGRRKKPGRFYLRAKPGRDPSLPAAASGWGISKSHGYHYLLRRGTVILLIWIMKKTCGSSWPANWIPA